MEYQQHSGKQEYTTTTTSLSTTNISSPSLQRSTEFVNFSDFPIVNVNEIMNVETNKHFNPTDLVLASTSSSSPPPPHSTFSNLNPTTTINNNQFNPYTSLQLPTSMTTTATSPSIFYNTTMPILSNLTTQSSTTSTPSIISNTNKTTTNSSSSKSPKPFQDVLIPVTSSGKDGSVYTVLENVPVKRTHRRRSANVDKDSLKCYQCNTSNTPEWRKGPEGPATLCNACGLAYAKKQKLSGKQMSVKTNPNINPADPINSTVTSFNLQPTTKKSSGRSNKKNNNNNTTSTTTTSSTTKYNSKNNNNNAKTFNDMGNSIFLGGCGSLLNTNLNDLQDTPLNINHHNQINNTLSNQLNTAINTATQSTPTTSITPSLVSNDKKKSHTFHEYMTPLFTGKPIKTTKSPQKPISKSKSKPCKVTPSKHEQPQLDEQVLAAIEKNKLSSSLNSLASFGNGYGNGYGYINGINNNSQDYHIQMLALASSQYYPSHPIISNNQQAPQQPQYQHQQFNQHQQYFNQHTQQPQQPPQTPIPQFSFVDNCDVYSNTGSNISYSSSSLSSVSSSSSLSDSGSSPTDSFCGLSVNTPYLDPSDNNNNNNSNSNSNDQNIATTTPPIKKDNEYTTTATPVIKIENEDPFNLTTNNNNNNNSTNTNTNENINNNDDNNSNGVNEKVKSLTYENSNGNNIQIKTNVGDQFVDECMGGNGNNNFLLLMGEDDNAENILSTSNLNESAQLLQGALEF